MTDILNSEINSIYQKAKSITSNSSSATVTNLVGRLNAVSHAFIDKQFFPRNYALQVYPYNVSFANSTSKADYYKPNPYNEEEEKELNRYVRNSSVSIVRKATILLGFIHRKSYVVKMTRESSKLTSR